MRRSSATAVVYIQCVYHSLWWMYLLHLHLAGRVCCWLNQYAMINVPPSVDDHVWFCRLLARGGLLNPPLLSVSKQHLSVVSDDILRFSNAEWPKHVGIFVSSNTRLVPLLALGESFGVVNYTSKCV